MSERGSDATADTSWRPRRLVIVIAALAITVAAGAAILVFRNAGGNDAARAAFEEAFAERGYHCRDRVHYIEYASKGLVGGMICDRQVIAEDSFGGSARFIAFDSDQNADRSSAICDDLEILGSTFIIGGSPDDKPALEAIARELDLPLRDSCQRERPSLDPKIALPTTTAG